MVAADWDALTTELGELRAQRDQLAAELAQSLERLRSQGAGLPRDLQQSVRRYRDRHLDLERRLSADPVWSLSAAAVSLDDWENVVRNGKRRRQLEGIFQDALRLEIRGAERPEPLASVHDEVERLQHQIAEEHASLADDLLEGRHVLASLLTLVRRGEELPDDQWTDLQDQVAARFGRDLSTAISRGRVFFSAETPHKSLESPEMSDRRTEVPA